MSAPLQLEDFPEVVRPHAYRRCLQGVAPHEEHGWVVNGRELSYDKTAHDWLKQHGFRHCGRKWMRPDNQDGKQS